MPSVEYTGPSRLAESRYASESAKSMVKPNGISTVVNKEQIDADSTKAHLSSGVQLALQQDNALQKEVHDQIVQLGKSTTTVDHARKLLGLLRDRMQEENPAADLVNGTLGKLWGKMEELHDAFQSAQVALPTLFDKQKDNLGLIVNSMVNEARQETRTQEKIQNKKIEQQDNLILGQNQAYMEYRARTDLKLAQLSAMEKQLAQQSSTNGTLRAQLEEMTDKYTKANNESQKGDADSAVLNTAVMELQDKVKSAEQKATDREQEVVRLGDAYDKEVEKNKALEDQVSGLLRGQSESKKNVDMLNEELDIAERKYENQAKECSSAFQELQDARKTLAVRETALKAATENLEKKNAECVQMAEQASKPGKEMAGLRQNLEDLKTQLATCKTEQEAASTEASRQKKDCELLLAKFNKLETENDNLKEENNNLVSEKTKANNSHISALTNMKDENNKLQKTIELLQEQNSSPSGGGDDAALQQEIETLKEALRDSEKNKAGLEDGLAQWQTLAKKSYDEYREILPTFKEAQAIRAENEQLKAKLGNTAASTPRINGEGDGYWRRKYEELLESLE